MKDFRVYSIKDSKRIWAGNELSAADCRQKTDNTRESGQRSGIRKALSCLLCLLILVSNLLQPVAAMDLPISFDPDHPEKTIVLHRLEKETESDQDPAKPSIIQTSKSGSPSVWQSDVLFDRYLTAAKKSDGS